MIERRALAGVAAALAAAPLAARPAVAQEEVRNYPDRPVRIIVPYAPGGANDILARLYGQKLSERLGQPFVVENRPGAQAILGTEAVARSRPDGTTLLLGASGPIVFNPATYAQLPYDSLRDLAPISLLASFPLVLVVAAASPHRSITDLIAWAKENPARANYGASGAGFQLPTELFNQRAGTRFQYVAYRGSADSVNAAANAEVTIALVDSGPASIAMSAGRVRALAVTSKERVPAYPDVPTMAELGFPEVEATLWSGVFAPASTPRSILDRLQSECAAITALPDIRDRLKALAMDPVGNDQNSFRGTIEREIGIWSAVARAAHIRLER
ncbi:Bug family tripartite tricarboxylate transporter substrate binding protein [Muricoccus vinaceus]|uniref:Bug family tripartite tricarboxylate transporter substrate binding protein n=1 Tax=Muricoccus vinaceus TaxID=424704 RepID=A0ABV6IQS1_9PROT